MARIGVFVKNLTSGGAEKQASLLARFLSDKHQVTFIIFNGEKVHDKYIALMGDRVTVKSFTGTRKERWAAFKKYLRQEHHDVLFSYLTAANAYACVGAPRSTRVVTGLRNARLPLSKHIADAVLTNLYACCTVTNCRSGKAHFASHGFRGKKIEVIPNCIDHVEPYAEKPASDEVRVITVGRFVAQKDYPTAIRAVAKAHEQAPQLRFTIVGYGELEAEVRRLVDEAGIADITEIVLNPPDIEQRLRRADIYLSTSLFEGISNSIMEGMGADLPVVATNVGDNDVLVEPGENGFLTAVADVDALAQALVKLADDRDLRLRMGRRSKEFLSEKFSPEMFAERYNELINRLIKSPSNKKC